MFENVAHLGGIGRFIKGRSIGRNQTLQGNKRETWHEISRGINNRFLLKGTGVAVAKEAYTDDDNKYYHCYVCMIHLGKEKRADDRSRFGRSVRLVQDVE